MRGWKCEGERVFLSSLTFSCRPQMDFCCSGHHFFHLPLLSLERGENWSTLSFFLSLFPPPSFSHLGQKEVSVQNECFFFLSPSPSKQGIREKEQNRLTREITKSEVLSFLLKPLLQMRGPWREMEGEPEV